MQKFSSLPLSKALLQNLDSLNYQQMTEIQAQSLPVMMEGRDIIAQAQTGSGKTAAFGLAILHHLNVKRFRVQTLVLCPTRELADQVANEIRRLARTIHNIKVLTLCGGMPFGPQIGSLEHGAHIVVGTPGRVEEHVRKGTLKLNDIQSFVLDEADRMLDMGFQPTIDAIVEQLPTKRQNLLFSATYPDEIEQLSARVLNNPVMVQVASKHDQTSIEQHFYKLENNDERLGAAVTLLMVHNPASAIVFCNTRREVDELATELCNQGVDALGLHGDLDQPKRDSVIVRFANKSATVLVATDVAARGIDIDDIELVINYQIAHDPDVHVHRVGRTGRAGGSGVACSLFSPREGHKFADVLAYINADFEAERVPPRPANVVLKAADMATLRIDGGKRDKVRPGDIVGALTKGGDIAGNDLGKIQVFPNCAYVAVRKRDAKVALEKINHGKLKGRKFRAMRIRGE